MVIDNKTGEIVAYVGNTNTTGSNSRYVDIIFRPRSTGSLLKPFLFLFLLDDNKLLPNMLVSDVPTNYNNYKPKNFDGKYRGLVKASHALQKSLNVPFVRLLKNYPLGKFQRKIAPFSIGSISSNSHYGLTIILGGAEASLFDLTRSYYYLISGLTNDLIPKPYYALNKTVEYIPFTDLGVSRMNTYKVLEIMKKLERPSEDLFFESEENDIGVSWKTGTSFGFKDAWAIGLNNNYTVGVWIGNASGKGRNSIKGLTKAGPILFEVFELLKKRNTQNIIPEVAYKNITAFANLF